MNFRRPVGVAVRRVALSHLRRARRQLERDGDERPQGIHQARRSIRHVRAALLLARPVLGERYAGLVQPLREAGWVLSPLRDAQSVLEAVENLSRSEAAPLREAEAQAICARLARSRRRAMHDADESIRAADALLERAQDDVAAWTARIDRECFWNGIRIGYRRGRCALAIALREPAEEALHRLRRRTREHWLQLELLRDTWPALVGAQADEARRLSATFGQERDALLLEERLARWRTAPAPGSSVEEITTRLAAWREACRREGLALGRVLYAESPRGLMRRLSAYADAMLAARAWGAGAGLGTAAERAQSSAA